MTKASSCSTSGRFIVAARHDGALGDEPVVVEEAVVGFGGADE